jgi:hypothetical protein
MRELFTARLPDTNVELNFSTDGNFVFLNGKKFGESFEDEQSYVDGLIDGMEAFSSFIIILPY